MEPPEYPLTAYPSCSQRLAFLSPSLRSMFSIMDSYLEKFDRVGQMDRPYFYTERATLSVFAGGVWRSHPSNLVLEEYSGEKGSSSTRYKGRFDIWFEVDEQSCYAEAKQCWPAASSFDEDEGQAIISVLCAEADVAQDNVLKEIKAGIVHHALGIVFVAPQIPKGRKARAESSISAFEHILGECLQVFSEGGCYDILRGTYLRRDLLENRWFDSVGQGARIYPGVDILICERRRTSEPAAVPDPGDILST